MTAQTSDSKNINLGHPLSGAAEDRMVASLDNWKRKLLDLTKRNRALNFRVNKVSTIVIVDEQPAEVFRQLCLQAGSMRFKPAPEPKELPQANEDNSTQASATPPEVETAIESQVPLEAEDTGPSLDFVPYDPAVLHERHTDNILQTASTAEQLDRSLRRIAEQAHLTIEEQGVNTLFLALGMVQYKEALDSKEFFRAPLVLVPVELTRKSARAGYVVKATENDPLVNPALIEYLRRSYSISLPELPDSASMAEDYDLQVFLKATAEVIATQKDWTVKTDIYLGLFSFQKFVMYKDVEANGAAIKQHRLVQQLMTRSGSQYIGLPDEIRTMDLDKDFAPERTSQVVDADSSQLRAIAASAKNYDLVVEGPPGTGKSQTITNLIAQALAANKSVLFVAEKMAALQVVYRRLVNAGLGEFCLELHSTKANKRAVMQELRVSLDASLQRPAAPSNLVAPRLPALRHSLTLYAHAVHEPHGALAISPYRAYGELGAVINAPKLKYSGPADTVTREQLDQTLREINDLTVAASAIGNPATHPWRDTSKTFYSEDDRDTLRDVTQDLLSRLEGIMHQANEIEASLNLAPILTFSDIETAALVAAVIARSPGAPLAVLENEVWNAPPPAANAILEHGRKIQRLKERISQNFTSEVFDQEHTPEIAYVEQKSQGLLGFLAILDSRYRIIQQQWKAYHLPHYRGSMLQQAQEMKKVMQLQQEQQALAAADKEARQLFGALWQGEQSQWDTLDSYKQWVVEFRAVCVHHGLTGRALETASRPSPDMSNVTALREAAFAAIGSLNELRSAIGWPMDYLQPAPIHEIAERVRSLAKNIHLGSRWAVFETARIIAAKGLAAEMLPPAMAGALPFDVLTSAFKRAFYLKWLAGVVQVREPLLSFNTLTHEQRVREFRGLDERLLFENRTKLVAGLREEVQKRLQTPEAAAAMPFLRREMARQRGLSPLRKTMKHAEGAIRAIKPCFMMSPLTVAQLLDGSSPSFDLVIFDEASQLPTEDAVGSIIRGKQLIVVGDPKQLPPTNFFSVMSGQVTAPTGEDGMPLYEDSESVLEEYLGSGLSASRLKWHYRSTHESLIAFSNISFYDADLYTFPSIETTDQVGGIQFEFVEGGLYEGKGLNQAEARRVADAVVEHAKTHPELSLGVGTFNLRQQIAIQDELEQRRRQDASLESFFASKEETFFVKNLENIQGDERDVIFISITYAKASDGRLRYNFGPLNSQNGWRRMNVLITRARKQMRVFSSIRGEDINAAATTSPGAKLLREFLLYAEHGRLESVTIKQAADTESPLERDVYQELTRRGVSLKPQVGVSGYRIDLGVLDPEIPGRFICGLECDGVAYHTSQTARDRDRLRQQVLEARGWTIHRVWSTDWFKDRQGQIERLLSLIAQSRERAKTEAEAENEARQHAAKSSEQEIPDAPSAVQTDTEANKTYMRPSLPSYRLTPGEGRFAGSDILQVPASQVQKAILTVVDMEAPLHMEDLVTRVAGMWDTRIGSRIRGRILEVCRATERAHLVALHGDFVWKPNVQCTVRSRGGTRIPAERIAPEEYREAILMILRTGYGFTRAELVSEVRALFGFGRAPELLQQAVDDQINTLLREGVLGESSTGIAIRQ